MHSNRMCTAHSLTVSCRILCMLPPQPRMAPCNHTWPPATTHAPYNHAPPSNHAHPPATMHTPLATMHPPSNHACPPNHACPWQPCTPPATMHAPWQPCMPPSNHACPSATTHAPLATMHGPPMDRILDTRFWKYYLAPNFFCGW